MLFSNHNGSPLNMLIVLATAQIQKILAAYLPVYHMNASLHMLQPYHFMSNTLQYTMRILF